MDGWSAGRCCTPSLSQRCQKNAAFYSLTHAAATLWFFSSIAFFVFLALLAEYSPTISWMWEGLTFLIEALSFFAWF